MVIVFRVDSSQQIGSGHVMRCLTLAERFRSKRKAEVIFLMRDLDGNLIDLVKKQEYKVNVLPRSAHDYDLSGYEAWLTVPQELDAEQSISCLSGIGIVDLLVVDSYAIDVIWEDKLRPYSKKIMVIDDLANRRHDCDILLDQNLYKNMNNRYVGLVPSDCTLFLGPQYALLRQEFYEARKRLKNRSEKLKNIVVFFGGVDATNETMKSLKALAIIDSSQFNIDVIVGNGNPHKKEIKTLCSEHHNWYYHCQVNNMAEFMAKADIAIGAGGTTTWERCFLHLPAIVIAVAENQIEIAEACANHGFIKYLGFHREVNVNDIVGAIRKVQGGYYHMLLKACIEEGKDYGSAEIFFEKCNRK